MSDEQGNGEPDLAVVMAAKINRAAEELKGELSLSEEGFRYLAAQAHPSARDYIVFEALDELQKVAVGSLQSLELCSGEAPDPSAAFSRLAAEAVEDWMSLLQRKLIEALADLVGLGESPGEPYFRDFLLHAQLDHLLASQKDMERYYGSESLNLASQIDELGVEIAALEASGLEPSAAWYRKRQAPFELGRARAGQLFASFDARLRHALTFASDDEKAGLGFSYGAGFGQASVGLHARPGPLGSAATLAGARSSITTTVAISISVLTRCQKILDAVPDGENSFLRGVVDENDGPTEILRKSMRDKAEVGDIVLAYDYLAQVLEVAEGPFGYQSYRVRYLSKPPLPQIPEDWHLASQVRLLLDLPRMREMVRTQAEARPGQHIEKLLDLDDARLRDAIAESVSAIDRADIGLREEIFSQAKRQSKEKEPDASADGPCLD